MTPDGDTSTAHTGAVVARTDVNGMRMAHLTSGPPDGPLALLVSGFPDSPWTWRHLTPDLVALGYHVVAPWTRGLAPTGPPPDGRFDVDALADDLQDLHAALGGGRDAVLVGHDWGAVAGQVSVGRSGSPWARAVLLAIPPLGAISHLGLGRLPVVASRLWYAMLFQVPRIEHAVARGLHPFVRLLWRRWSPDYEATETDLEAAVAALSGVESTRMQLSYYRAAARRLLTGRLTAPLPATSCPTLFLHGHDDGCIDVALAHAAQRDTPGNSRIEVIDGVGHFLHLEAPQTVNERILRHLRG